MITYPDGEEQDDDLDEFDPDQLDDDENEFDTCADCDQPDACSDFLECAIKAGIAQPKQW